MTTDLCRRLVICVVAPVLTVAMSSACSGSPDATASRSPRAATSASGDVAVSQALVTRLAEALPRDLPTFLGSQRSPNFVGLRAALMQVDGHVVFEEHYGDFSASDTNSAFSITKSVTSTLVGIALDEGAIPSVNQTLAQLLPERAPDMKPAVAAITLRQLLTMTAGLSGDDVGDPPPGVFSKTDWVGNILRAGQQHSPGRFDYANSSSHLLAAILARATGGSVLDYAERKLFGPLGIDTQPAFEPLAAEENAAAYERARFAWPVDPSGLNLGYTLLKLRPRDMAKIGTLYLNGGTWHGTQVLSASYVRDATTGQVRAEGYALQYGYQWWVTSVGRGHAAFAAVGWGGQLIEVVPALRLVAVYSTYVPNRAPGTDSRAYMNITSTLVAKAERQ